MITKEPKLKNPSWGTIPNKSIAIRSKWPFIMLFIVAYGILFFILQNKILFTPDFGSSDAFHSNISLKHYLWQSIRSGSLPFWTNKLAGGFPLIGETQIGAFFLPHFLVFPFFAHFTHAYAFLFSFHLFLLSVGMFLLLSELRISSFLSFLLAVTFTWSGAVTFRWVHFNFLQVFSLGPFLFLAYFKWKSTSKKKYLFYASFIICQMIFAGHMQTTFILLFGLTLMHLLINTPLTIKKNIQYATALFFGLIFAAPQVLPTIQLSRYSVRSLINPYQYVVSFVYNARDLGGFVSAKIFGTPYDASYGNLSKTGNRIYWENTPYVGEIFMIVLLISSIYFFWKMKKRSIAVIFLLLFVFFVLIAFGGDSPFYFIFGIFPFNMFRTQARYLLGALVFLMIFSAYCFQSLIDKPIRSLIIYGALILNCCVLVKNAFNYHMFVEEKILFSSLKTLSLPSRVGASNILTLGGNGAWNDVFAKRGWNTKENKDMYLFFNMALFPNSNLIAGISSFDVYTGGLKMRRNEYIKSIIIDNLNLLTKNQKTDQEGEKIENILELYDIGSIISFEKIHLPHFLEVKKKEQGNYTISLLHNSLYKNNVWYIPSEVKPFFYLEDFEKEMSYGRISEGSALAEGIEGPLKQERTSIAIHTIIKGDSLLKSTIETAEKKYVVAKMSWYPEWYLFIDGKIQPIYKTNLMHMGFFVPKGKHIVELRYIPTSFYMGCLVAVGGIFFASYFFRKNSD